MSWGLYRSSAFRESDTLGLLKFMSPSAMESVGLYPQTEEDESEFYSSDSDEGGVGIEK